MPRVELPQSKLRRRRRRRRVLLISGIVLMLVLLIAGVAWLLRTPFVRVGAIEVSGARSVATSSVEEYVRSQLLGTYLWIFPRNSIFLYPREGIREGLLLRYPELREADVHASNFHTVSVTLSERQPVALWCPSVGFSGPCSYMDESGIIYAPAPVFSEPVYVEYQGAATGTAQTGLRQYLTQAQFQSLAALVVALDEAEADNPVRQVVVEKDGAARAYFQDDFLLIFSSLESGGDVFERFSLALQSAPFKGKKLSDFEYLDLRYGDKLYYKEK
jgi:cell division septal protein FtsQ